MEITFAEICIEYPIKEQVIWNNKNIYIKKKPQYWKHWHEQGIIYISDIINNN